MRWVEKLVPVRRLTCIVMPHRGQRPSLRQAKVPAQGTQETDNVKGMQDDGNATAMTELFKMSAIQI